MILVRTILHNGTIPDDLGVNMGMTARAAAGVLGEGFLGVDLDDRGKSANIQAELELNTKEAGGAFFGDDFFADDDDEPAAVSNHHEANERDQERRQAASPSEDPDQTLVVLKEASSSKNLGNAQNKQRKNMAGAGSEPAVQRALETKNELKQAMDRIQKTAPEMWALLAASAKKAGNKNEPLEPIEMTMRQAKAVSEAFRIDAPATGVDDPLPEADDGDSPDDARDAMAENSADSKEARVPGAGNVAPTNPDHAAAHAPSPENGVPGGVETPAQPLVASSSQPGPTNPVRDGTTETAPAVHTTAIARAEHNHGVDKVGGSQGTQQDHMQSANALLDSGSTVGGPAASVGHGNTAESPNLHVDENEGDTSRPQTANAATQVESVEDGSDADADISNSATQNQSSTEKGKEASAPNSLSDRGSAVHFEALSHLADSRKKRASNMASVTAPSFKMSVKRSSLAKHCHSDKSKGKPSPGKSTKKKVLICHTDARESKSGLTALHIGTLMGRKDLVEILVREGGADSLLKDTERTL